MSQVQNPYDSRLRHRSSFVFPTDIKDIRLTFHAQENNMICSRSLTEVQSTHIKSPLRQYQANAVFNILNASEKVRGMILVKSCTYFLFETKMGIILKKGHTRSKKSICLLTECFLYDLHISISFHIIYFIHSISSS